MMNPSMMGEFGAGPGGPMVSGRWINKKTGQVINVRDSFIDGDSMVIMSDRGQIPFNEFSQYYIQASDEVYDENGKVIDKKSVELSDIADVNPGNNISHIEEQKIVNELTTPLRSSGGSKVIVEESGKNFGLIDKIFQKKESRPKLNLKIDWADFPNKELSMLVDYFDVSKEEIADYIGKHLINSDLLNESLNKWLKENLVCEK